MPDYRRFIAYFYEYIDGKCQRNAGFVKAEKREGNWRICLQIKGRRWPDHSLEIRGYIQEAGWYDTVLLEKAYPQKDCLIQKFQIPQDVRTDGGKPFEELTGMWIFCEDNRCFLSQWREGSADVEKLKESTEKYHAGMTRVSQQEGSSVPEFDNFKKRKRPQRMEPQECLEDMKRVLCKEDTAEPEEAWNVEPEVLAEREEKGNAEAEEAVLDEQKEAEEPMETVLGRQRETEKTVRYEQAEEESVSGKRQEEREKKKEKNSGKDREWAILRERHPVHLMFAGEYECMSICLRELSWLAQQGWRTGRNSFLNQQFAQYRYLLLGRKKDGSYLLGAPGREHARIRKLAEQFGFGLFKSAENRESFGYWCREMK